ncbi:hypothetical protein DWV13_03725 [Clostridium botulinum]|uniref:NACHT domain-containing protein n=1 Tax=Clostridium TaxID=1485 RepID=UPI0013FA8579|nr:MULTISPECIES: hypothetical protein [Clostridium]MCS6130771.1 hypothetical protein [Clostridium botulinum]NFL44733.1 hypothetical protein [Clostridium botulinum]NFL89142.1 hypothetical protein [Clostridium botulinum]
MIESNTNLKELINYVNGKKVVFDRVAMLASVTITAVMLGNSQVGSAASTSFTILGTSMLPEIKKIINLINEKDKESEATEIYEKCRFTQVALTRLAVKYAIEKNLNGKNGIFATWKLANIINEQQENKVKKLDEERELKSIKAFSNNINYSNEDYWDELLKAILEVIEIETDQVQEFKEKMKQEFVICYEAFKNQVTYESEVFKIYISNLTNINSDNKIIEKLNEFSESINSNGEISNCLSKEWLYNRLKQSIANLGERYSAELDIFISEEKILDYICSDSKANGQIMDKIKKIEEFLNKEVSQTYKDKVMEDLNACKVLICGNVKKEQQYEQVYISKIFDDLIEICRQIDRKKTYKSKIDIIEELQNMNNNKFNRNIEMSCNQCISDLEELKDYISTLFYPYVLIKGKAGVGKSHFIAHCAKKHFENDGASILILGNMLIDNQPILIQIKQLLDIDCSMDDFLNNLNTYGKNSKKRSIIFFDALNECNNRWQEEIFGFIKIIEAYPWIGIVMSLRSNINKEVEDQLLSKFRIKKVELKGLSNIRNAISQFSMYYNIPVNKSSNLKYILNTPLLLKLYCKSYCEQEDGQPIYLKSIMNGYISNVNKKICIKKGYSSKKKLIKKMLNIFVDCILETGKREVDYEDYEIRLNQLLDVNVTENRLIDELIEQNIISDICHTVDGEETTLIFFEYEFLGDYFITERILELEKVAEFRNKQQLNNFLSSKNRYFEFISEFRIREMLIVLLPDIECKYEIAGFEILNWPYEFQEMVDDWMVCNSLLLRNPKKINRNMSYSYFINNTFLFYDYDSMYSLFYTFLKLCISKEHCYNIEFLQELFQRFTNQGVHRQWTVFISERLCNSDEFKDILYLAKSQNNILDESEKQLLGITLAWCLLSLDENVIIKCEDALLEMYKENIAGLVYLMKNFTYYDISKVSLIMERLFLIAMHCIFRSHDNDGKKALSNYIFDNVVLQSTLFKNYFIIHEYVIYILNYAYECGFISDFNMNNFYDSNPTCCEFEKVSSCNVEKLIKNKTLESDDELYEFIENNQYDNYDYKEYYKCNNNVIYSLMSLYSEVSVEFKKIEFKTEKFIDLILPDYRESFCKNVISKIFELGYNYIEFGFYDLGSNDDGKYIAQNYERMAFNIIFMKYIKNIGYISKDYYQSQGREIKYSGLWALTYYEESDISSLQYQFYQNDWNDKLFNFEELVDMIKSNKFIRIDSSYSNKNKVRVYILKTSNIDIQNILNYRDPGSFCEGIYFSEIFVSKEFYKYFELFYDNSNIIPVTKTYLWDYNPFSEFTIISPFFYKEMNLSISEDKQYYYYEDKMICKNTIKESCNDQFLIDADFLRDFLIMNMYSIVWVFEEASGSLERKNAIIQYDGKNICKI